MQIAEAQKTNGNKNVNLKLIVTTDVHGAIFPYDFVEGRASDASLAQVYSMVKAERQKKGQEVILLDNGDILQGQPVVYYSNFEDVKNTHNCAKVMNYMKYDAGNIGNHDIEAGHPVYDKLVKEFKFPWLSANSIDLKTEKPYFQPYTILERKGLKIAVLGLITPAIPTWLPEKIWSGMRFDDMIESANKWVKIIKDVEKPDLIVVLCHAGFDYSYNNQKIDTYKNENASALVAEKVEGIDIVFCGHDHQLLNKTIVGVNSKNVYLLDPRFGATYVASVDIRFEHDGEKFIRKEVKPELVEIKNFKPDVEFTSNFKKEFEAVKKFVSKPVGYFGDTISIRDAMFGNSAFIDLIHTVQFEVSKADISFADPLSFDATIFKGDVFVRDLFKLYKFENLLYTMSLSGKEVLDYLEYSYAGWMNQMTSADDHLLLYKKDETTQKERLVGRFFNFSSAAGIIYNVNVTNPKGSRVNIISMADGTPFDLNKMYKVAVNSYRGNGGGGHLIEGSGISSDKLSQRVMTSTEKDMRYYLMQWIITQKKVYPKAFGNWKVIPEDYWIKGKERDMKQMYEANPRVK